MSTRDLGWTLVGMGCGLIAGVALTQFESTLTAERRAKKRYDEQLEIHKRVLDRTITLTKDSVKVELPAAEEHELIELKGTDWAGDTELKVGGEMIAETPIAGPDYVGSAALYADPGTFINGDKVLSMEYIEEEDYEEEDGRAKEQITIFMGGEEPIFVMDGEQIENWAELIGDHILVDFYQRVPPGQADRVLYVRNHKRDEDYEVWQTVP